MKTATPPLPASAVSHRAAVVSLVAALAVFLLFKSRGWHDPETCFLFIIAAVALPHLWLELPRQLPAQPAEHAARAGQRLAIKLIGLAATFAAIAALLLAFRGFYAKYYVPLIEAYQFIWIPVAVLAAPYVWFTDRRMADPKDGLYHFGLLVTGRLSEVNRSAVEQYLLGWVVKAFFAPLMIRFALDSLQWFFDRDLWAELVKPRGYFTPAFKFLYMVDVWFAFTGYIFTLRLFNSHIRSVEPTMFGWVVCLICYPPFYPVFETNFADYEEGFMWGHWLGHSDVMWTIWSLLVLIPTAVVAWTTVAFGIRFSNLTHRGIITNGPYRFSKHPSYLAKNLSWWFIAVPFVSNEAWYVALGNCLVLLLWNGVYLLRAITEERHLSRDADYRAYAVWMAEHGLLARLKRRLRIK